MTITPDDFAGRRVVVSGASSGIGRAVAVELSQCGAQVVLIGRRKDKLEETARLCGDATLTQVLALDLLQTAGIAPAMALIATQGGRLYGLCHCAGAVQTLPLAASTAERLRAMMDLNFIAGMELVRALIRREVLDERGGAILWMASVYAHVGAPGQAGYCASKGAITSAVRAMALELASRKVRVNCLSPGLVRSEMTATEGSRLSAEQWARIAALHPLGVGQPEDIARAAAFMLSPRNPWLTGADLVIDGGYTLA